MAASRSISTATGALISRDRPRVDAVQTNALAGQPNRIPIRHQGAALHARARRMGQRESRTPASDALDWETSFGRGDATGLAILGAWTGWPYSAYAVIGAFAAFWAHKAVQHARTKPPHTTASPFMPWITTATNVAIAHALLARTAG